MRCGRFAGLPLLAALLSLAVPVPARSQQALQPNIVLITVDDLGWTDLSVQGSTYLETPHIDGLAAQGMRFTDAYAAASICSPSRAAMLTGRYPARIGITDWIRSRFQGGEIPADRRHSTEWVGAPGLPLLTPPNPLWMDHSEVTLAEVLEPLGYRSAHIGKWHLGTEPWFPESQGFHENAGGTDYGQPPSYFDPYFLARQGGIPNLPPRTEGEYLTDREADEAVRFIAENRDGPFFLNLAHYAVHTPLQAPPDLVARYRQKPPTNQRNPTYAAMVKSVDEAVGRVLAALEAAGVEERTIVIFTSDNGGLLGPTDNAPLRSGKGFPYEGGLRVPLIIRWPGRVPAATVSWAPVMGIDLFPTLVDAVGARLPEGRVVDGISLLPHLRSGGAEPPGREDLFWHFPHYRQGREIPPYSVLRSGEWKLIRWWEGSRELYNLRDDIGESRDRAGEMPDRVAEMDARLDRWLQEVEARVPLRTAAQGR